MPSADAIRDILYDLAVDRRALPVTTAALEPGLVVIDLEKATAALAALASLPPAEFRARPHNRIHKG